MCAEKFVVCCHFFNKCENEKFCCEILDFIHAKNTASDILCIDCFLFPAFPGHRRKGNRSIDVRSFRFVSFHFTFDAFFPLRVYVDVLSLHTVGSQRCTFTLAVLELAHSPNYTLCAILEHYWRI